MGLLHPETRWFYTMFLLALGRYLDAKVERGELDAMYAYRRESLLHYARWMADREYPYLDKPEALEYPTETWAAQDMRKSEVFKFAALHATGEEKQRFLERSEFFFQASVRTLGEMPTRTLTRPVVLLLVLGQMHAWFAAHPEAAAPAPSHAPADFGAPQRFVPQKLRAMRRAKTLAAAFAVLVAAVAGWGVWRYISP